MPDGTDETLSGAVARWLAEFEKALCASDDASLEALFQPDAHWRDLLAFTWHVKTVSGARQIIDQLKLHGAGAGAAGFAIDRQRTPPRRVTRAGTEVIEAFFRFETTCGRAQGLLRLIPGINGVCKVWTLLTALDEIKGFEETVGS